MQERGEISEIQVMKAFHLARAANAVLSGLNDNAQIAASEAVYEAYHALEDGESFLLLLALQIKRI